MIQDMTSQLTLFLLLEKPPAGVDYGLQKGSGAQYEVNQKQRSAGKDLHFTLTVAVKGQPGKDPNPDFGGPFVQGKKGERFFYIGIGTYAGQTEGWSRRLKIPLAGITWQLIASAADGLQARVPGTGKDGTPTCATVRPPEGWVKK